MLLIIVLKKLQTKRFPSLIPQVFLMPIPDPNKPEQHEGWCPLGEAHCTIIKKKKTNP